MRRSRWVPSPRSPGRRGVRRDTIAFVPASMLPFKREWQRLANALPEGSALFVLPDHDPLMNERMHAVATQLRLRGHQVTSVTTTQIVRSS